MNRRLPYRAQLTSKASEVLRIGTRDVWICSTVEQIVSFVIGTFQWNVQLRQWQAARGDGGDTL